MSFKYSALTLLAALVLFCAYMEVANAKGNKIIIMPKKHKHHQQHYVPYPVYYPVHHEYHHEEGHYGGHQDYGHDMGYGHMGGHGYYK
ncbi:hypothetical protein TYRP_012404 [Tyrophagus putrescentiae]|nr:hypothetical protein TYRP_012404 [Tyrophagus putrescentiae]